MILFNWKKVYRRSQGDHVKILEIIRYITFRPTPINKQDPNYSLSLEDWKGDSFLLNPEGLLSDMRVHRRERAQYVGIASARSMSEFLLYGKITLDLTKSPIGQDALKHNRLLSIDGRDIKFKWEEVARRKNNGSI